jgi:predicted aspartyl protease
MGTFHTQVQIQHLAQRDRSVVIDKALVDTGSEYTWIDGGLLDSIGIQREKKDLTFPIANGQSITRSMGFAIVRSGEFFTIDEVVFGQPGDLQLLGARSLEGFNARVDSQRKTLVAAGPIPAASGLESLDGKSGGPYVANG